jgi:hypothetical protein
MSQARAFTLNTAFAGITPEKSLAPYREQRAGPERPRRSASLTG